MKQPLLVLLALVSTTAAALAQSSTVPISGLPPAATPLSGSEMVAVVQSGATRRATVSNLFSARALTGSPHEWVSAAGSDGRLTCSQPGFADISGAISHLQLPSSGSLTILGNPTEAPAAAQDMPVGAGVFSALSNAPNSVSGFTIFGAEQAVVPNNTALSALPISYATAVARLGYSSLGDGPALVFTPSNSACTLNAGAGDGASQVPSLDGKCWLGNFGGEANLLHFGASATAADNSTAINNWLALLGTAAGGDKCRSYTVASPAPACVILTAPAGQFDFKSPLAAPAEDINKVTIRGGGGITTFRYTGAPTTPDLLTFGNPALGGMHNSNHWNISNIRVTSATTMTAGAAIRFNKLSDAHLENISVGTLDLESDTPDVRLKNWDGLYFYGFHEVFLTGYQIAFMRNDGVRALGLNAPVNANTNLIMSGGYTDLNAGVGIHALGAANLFVDNGESLGNTVAQVKIDNRGSVAIGCTTMAGVCGNREMLFGAQFVADGTQVGSNYGYYIDDNLIQPGTPFQVKGLVGSAGTGAADIYVKNYPSGNISISSPLIETSLADAIKVDDATTQIQIAPETIIANNIGYAINATVPTNNIWFSGRAYSNNGGANGMTANARVGWYTYTGTYQTDGNGTYSVIERLLRLNSNAYMLEVVATISDVGDSPANYFRIGLLNDADYWRPAEFSLMPATIPCTIRTTVGQQYAATGVLYAYNQYISIAKYDNASPATAVGQIYCSGMVATQKFTP
ncbi:hypothetical protein [Methylosinus sp. LW3]|uniref:hypothetical protein n=1 Tax=Methylosinus sp. LW3 TaxID=107635 RepID=UPI0004B07602|nr:hypothetical protein [Methylosinus sp. LW3]